METIEFTEAKYKSLKKQYNQAVKNGLSEFTFEGHVFLTDYAKYLLEYLSSKFEKKHK